MCGTGTQNAFEDWNRYIIPRTWITIINPTFYVVDTRKPVMLSSGSKTVRLKTLMRHSSSTIMANWPMLGSVILPNLGGWANGLYFAGQIRNDKGEKVWYDELKKAPWNPPKWVFGPAWTALYSSMGYAAYLVWEECDGFTEDAVVPLSLYGGQLVLNWAWTPIFFGLKDYKLALISICALSGAATATAGSFYKVNKTAGLLLLPYLAWLGYATSLSYYIWKNNPQPAIKDKGQ